MIEIIKNIAQKHLEKLVYFRREMHQNPELSFEEFETTRRIENYLDSIGVAHNRLAETGTVTRLGDPNKGKTIALRGDIDALPILEDTGLPFSSKNNGVMHACGHDIHTTCLLGALSILKELDIDNLGEIKGIFQAGEEKLPGGASILIDKGVLEGVDQIYGLHVMPELQVGKFGFRPGQYMASTDELHIRIIGKGGHGAMPERCINPIEVAADIIHKIQEHVKKFAPKEEHYVLTIGKIIGKGATNVIPREVSLEGTFRAMNEDWRAKAHEIIHGFFTDRANSFGATVEVDIRRGYPFLKNDESVTSEAILWANEVNGPENVIALDKRMTAEDFSFYSQVVPACFYRLGVGNTERENPGVHNPGFNADEQSIFQGSVMMAWLAYNALSK